MLLPTSSLYHVLFRELDDVEVRRQEELRGGDLQRPTFLVFDIVQEVPDR
jgi:hypothetical protein